MVQRMKQPANSGFTLVELVIVMGVIAIIISVVTPTIKGMQDEGALVKAEGDLKTIKSAVTSFWRNNGNVFPSNINALVTASPQIISEAPRDPWNTGQHTGEPGTYAYLTGVDSDFGGWFLSCSEGPMPRGGTTGGGGGMPTFDPAIQKIKWVNNEDNSRCVSNAPVVYADGAPHKHAF